jgi:hypothetical protein
MKVIGVKVAKGGFLCLECLQKCRFIRDEEKVYTTHKGEIDCSYCKKEIKGGK